MYTSPFFLPNVLPLSLQLGKTDSTGIVIKYESMEYRAAVHHAALVLDLASKSKKYMRELFEPPDVRRTKESVHVALSRS